MADNFSFDKYIVDTNKCIAKYNQLLSDINRICGLKYRLSLDIDMLFLFLLSTPEKKLKINYYTLEAGEIDLDAKLYRIMNIIDGNEKFFIDSLKNILHNADLLNYRKNTITAKNQTTMDYHKKIIIENIEKVKICMQQYNTAYKLLNKI